MMKGYGYTVLTVAIVTIIYTSPMAYAITLPIREVIKTLAQVNSIIG